MSQLPPQLAYFTGTENYWRWSPLFNDVLTDGAKYIAEEMGAFWLMDVIASHLSRMGYEDFIHIKLDVEEDQSAVVTLDDGNDVVLVEQEIEYTDFPYDEIDLYACYDGIRYVIMLPGEY